MADYSCASVLILLLLIVAFIMQLVAYFTPYWACTPSPCDLGGLFYKCIQATCEKKILDNDIMTLDTIVLISNFVLVVVLIFTSKMYSFRFGGFSREAIVGIGIWAGINDVLAVVGLILVYARFQVVAWSANLFTGTAVSFCIIGAIAFMVCIKGTCSKVAPW
ncbi:hypothetical protein ACJMK2_041444 [Sinanodonta woodiana]|uniref:Transmembrane protein n=1 Tax=Sinanodonta woodiana TaxID=1069815 RepID=A0ABD3W4U6_SINWO